jgi:peptidoglycan L-alanyl-D-glutamate endopeptidase CwlK
MAAPQAAGATAPTAAEVENDFLNSITGVITPPVPDPTFDAATEYAISTLRPDLQGLARQHIFTLKQAAVDARIVQGSRSYSTQAQLYAQGRTTPGNIVTNAAPGTSAHNYGAAYDIGVFGPSGYQGGGDAYTILGPAAAPPGVSWGNNIPGFPKGDLGHYELPNWRSLPNLQVFR